MPLEGAGSEHQGADEKEVDKKEWVQSSIQNKKSSGSSEKSNKGLSGFRSVEDLLPLECEYNQAVPIYLLVLNLRFYE